MYIIVQYLTYYFFTIKDIVKSKSMCRMNKAVGKKPGKK